MTLSDFFVCCVNHAGRKGGASLDADAKATDPPGAGLGAGAAKDGDIATGDLRAAESSDDDDDDEGDDAKTAAPPEAAKAPTGAGRPVAPPVAQSKDAGDGAFDGFGSAKSAESQHDEKHTKNDYEERRGFMLRPCPRGGSPDTQPTYQCFIVRDRGGSNRMSPVYRLFAEPPPGEERSRAPFIASARKRMMKGSSNFLISVDKTPNDRASDAVVGKLRSDWSGAAYCIYDHGLNPTKTENVRLHRRELGLLQFEYDQMGPGSLRAVVPAVSDSGAIDIWKPQTAEDTIAATVARGGHLKADAGMPPLHTLENKRPHWDEAQKGHVLNFKGRVTQSSVKNFQLRCEALSGDLTVLQFGRVDKHIFTMDYTHPLSPLQAFALCLSVFDGKMSDYKDFDSLFGGAKSTGGQADAKGGDGESGSTRVEGSMGGAKGLFGGLQERLPSRQYLSDKVRRFSS